MRVKVRFGFATVLFVWFAVMALMLGGCATYSAFQSGGTAADKKAAACIDAQRAYDLADYWIPKVGKGTDAARYWRDYKVGAEVALGMFCGPGK